MVEPAFLAVTNTPSIGPSSFAVPGPASAAAPSASDGAVAANTKVRQTPASSALRIRIFRSSLGDLRGPREGRAFRRPSPGEPAAPNTFGRLIGRECAG